MIHHVLAGRRPMPASVARALGWDLVTEYRRRPPTTPPTNGNAGHLSWVERAWLDDPNQSEAP